MNNTGRINFNNAKWVEFEILRGKVFSEINVFEDDIEEDRITFITEEGETYIMFHDQVCSECVYIEDIIGNLNNLIGYEILSSEAVSEVGETDWGTQTSTFYKLDTIRGSVTIRWNGESNGFYSEEVSLAKMI